MGENLNLGPSRRISLKGLLEACWVIAALGIAICTFTGFLGRFWWLFDLTSHFRAQYLAGGLLLGMVALARRRWFVAIALLGLSGINFGILAPHLWATGRTARPDSTNVIRAALVNVLFDNPRADLVLAFLRETKPDFAVLLEVNDRWQHDLASLRDLFPYAVVEPSEDSFGIALLSRHPFESTNRVEFNDWRIVSIAAEIRVRGQVLTVLATHPPPPFRGAYAVQRNQHLLAIPAFLNTRTGSKVLLGDLNNTPWNYYFNRLTRESALNDTTPGFGFQPTWHSRIWPLRIPIDHCLLSTDLAVVSRRVGPCVGSDHFPLLVDFALAEKPPERPSLR